jgi:hypothetical protein
VASLIEGAIGTNWHVSHRFDSQKDAKILSEETVYAWRREGRERPGILIITGADQPAVFWDMDRDEPNGLRMQIPFGFTRMGPTIFVATLLRGERRLILEDMWVDAGKNLKMLPFSSRWNALQTAFRALSAQQLYLGFDLVTVDPRPLQEFIAAAEPGNIWDFQPEKGGRKRLYYVIPGARVGLSAGAQARAAEAKAHITMPAAVNKNALKRTAQMLTIRVALLCQDPATTLPDSYILKSADGVVIGKPTVTRMAQSKELRAALGGAPDGYPVEVGWHKDFKKYEVLRILPADSPLTSAGAFFENRSIE